jgi:hypothetical protein
MPTWNVASLWIRGCSRLGLPCKVLLQDQAKLTVRLAKA